MCLSVTRQAQPTVPPKAQSLWVAMVLPLQTEALD